MLRRNYRNSLDFVADAFRACWGNANELVAESKLLLDNGYRARGLSLSVLALEELGKLFCVNGLLFSRADDNKALVFAKSLKSHTTKLSALTVLPLLLQNIASIDPRYTSEKRFMQTIIIGAKDLKDRGNAVFALLDGEGFSKLDYWKQTGFYAQPIENSFVKPSTAITTEIADAVYMLAWRATSTLDFLLKDGNLERYIDNARRLRAKMTEADHAAMSAAAEEMVDLLFPTEGGEENDKHLH